MTDLFKVAAVIVGLVSALGGFVAWSGVPPYASRIELAGLSIQVYEDQAYRLQRKVWDLEDRKRRMVEKGQRGEWFRYYERQLLEAQRQLKIVHDRIKRLQRGGKR